MKNNRIEALVNAFWLISNILAVVGIVMMNKLVFVRFKFHFGTLLTVIHFVFTSAGLECGKAAGLIERKTINWWKVVPLSASFCGFVVLTNLSLQYNSIGFYQMAKVMTTPILTCLQFLFYGKKFSRNILLSLAFVCGGVCLATATEIKLTLLGVSIAFAACFVTAWIETEQKRLGLNAMQLLSYQAPISALLLVGFVPLFDNYREIIAYKMTIVAAASIMASAALALCVNVTTFMIIGKMSAMTYNVAGHAKLCFILAAGYILFDSDFRWLNMIGVGIAISGVVAYSLIKMKENSVQVKRSEPSTATTGIKLTEIDMNVQESSDSPKRSLLIYNNEVVTKNKVDLVRENEKGLLSEFHQSPFHTISSNQQDVKLLGKISSVSYMSSWKDSSDFASLSAAISKAKMMKKTTNTAESKAADKDNQITQVETENKIEKTPVKIETSNTLEYSDIPDSTDLLPLTQSISFKQHKSTVSTLEFEASGSRFLSGSHDNSVAYWDFNGMVKDQPEPFRFIEPMGSYAIRSVKYSKDSQWVLMAASSSCAKLFDRNGSQVREYGKGDPYIRDLKHTTGHVAALISATWLPHDSDRFLTASEDGTMRIWHIGQRHKSEFVIPVKSSLAGSGGRSPLTSIAFDHSDSLVSASLDGSIKLWDTRTLLSNCPLPAGSISSAHQVNQTISSLSFNPQNVNVFASRSIDGTVKLWDKRKLSGGESVCIFSDLPTIQGETDVLFIKEKIFTGISGGLAILDPSDPLIRRIIPRKSGVVSLIWNQKTDQIVTGSSDGSLEVFYSPQSGNGKGVLLMKQSTSASRLYGEVDITAAELVSKSSSTRAPSKRKLDKIRADPVKSHRPEVPVTGPGQGGRIGSNVTQSIMKNILKDTSRDVDPRAALLAYAEQAAKNPKFVTTAYQETQPDPMLDASLLEKEAAVEAEKQRKMEQMEKLKADRERISDRFK